MSMNRQGFEGDGKFGIEWCRPPIIEVNGHELKRPGFTLNVSEGCTNYWCEVREHCWGKDSARRHQNPDFTPRFHVSRLSAPLRRRTPAIIALNLKGDGFCDGVPDEWIHRTLRMVGEASWHVFIWLTKNPARFRDFPIIPSLDNLWVGTSIGTTGWKSSRLWALHQSRSPRKVLSVEPILEPLRLSPQELAPMSCAPIDWVFLGGRSGRSPFRPPEPWVHDLIQDSHHHNIPVLIKDNAGYPETVREWPHKILEYLQREVIHCEA